MSVISTLKSLLGLKGGRRDGPRKTVPVEREPAAESERAVKESVSERAGATDVDGEPVDSIPGIGPAYAERLGDAGVETVRELAGADATELAAATGLGEGRIAGWIEAATDA